MKFSLLCALALQDILGGGASFNQKFLETKYQDRFETCVEVAEMAEGFGIDPFLAVSTAFTESRFNKHAVSRAGAVGPLQVLPKYFCPKGRVEGCDLGQAGIAALLRFLLKYGNEHDALCHYNAGNKCGKQAHRYARNIIQRRDRWQKELSSPHWSQIFLLSQCNACPECCVFSKK